MPKFDPTLSAAQRADAACDSFERAWRAGRNPRVEDYVAAAPDGEQDALRSALQKVEAELRSVRGVGETSGGANAERTGSHHARPGTITPDTPSHIGRFEVRAVLGAGAFGRVYRAFDPTLDREVAIKVPQPGTLQTDADTDRFLREARSAATVSHPNVCQIFEVGRHDGQPYIVMAMVPGQSLQQALRGRAEPLPERQAAIIARKIALALDAAHKKGVVHRDLKPANVMFDKERKDFVVMDFGLARRAESGDVRATRSGAVMGTPAYMSPEQARGEARDVGPETDIFSLGVMLYEMLAGVRPFAGSSAHEVMGRILLMEPQPPAELRPGLDPLLEAACLKALAKDPAKRFASMGEFAAALDVFLYRPAAPGAETVRPTATKGEGRSVTESQHLGNLFARMTADEHEDEDGTEATRRPAGKNKNRTKKKPKQPAGPRWPVVGGLLAGLLVVAVAGLVFFTRSGSVEVAAKLKDVDLNDTTLIFTLDGKAVTADALKQPMELKPGKYVFEAKRGEAIVKRYSLVVEGRRRPSIEAEDTTPRPDQTRVQAPPKPVVGSAKKDNEPNPNPVVPPKEPDPPPAPVVPPKEPDPAPAVPSADLFQPGSVWTAAEPPLRKFTVVERKGETFHATFEIGVTIVRDITGTVRDGKVSWLAKDVKPARGGAGGDNVGTLVRRDGKDAIDFEWKGPGAASGTFTLWLTAAGAAPADGFVPLFGKDLTGWEGLPGMWKWQGGALVGTSVPAITKNTYLYSQAQYADFELKFDARLKNGTGNSGVQIRSSVADPKSANVIGPQVEIATAFGGLYGEGIGGWLKQVPEATVRQVFKPNDFNAYHIRVVGKRVVIVVNGTTLVDDTFPTLPDRGVIGFQFHSKQQPEELTFRNVLIRDLSADGFVPLFNGKDLTGWKTHPSQRGNWRVESGLIVASKGDQPGAAAASSHLYTARGDYRDFHLQLEARVQSGISGVYFRAPFGPTFPADAPTWVGAYNAKLDKNRVGGLIVDGDFGRPLVRDEVVSFEFKRWTALDVIAQGNRFEIRIDGKTTATFVDKDRTYTKGHIVLQQHGGATAVEFRNVRVKELPEEPGPK